MWNVKTHQTAIRPARLCQVVVPGGRPAEQTTEALSPPLPPPYPAATPQRSGDGQMVPSAPASNSTPLRCAPLTLVITWAPRPTPALGGDQHLNDKPPSHAAPRPAPGGRQSRLVGKSVAIYAVQARVQVSVNCQL